MVYTVHPNPPLIYAQKLAHHMKFCAILMKDLSDARDHTHAKPDPRMIWIITAQAPLIAQSTARPTNTTAQLEKMKMDANYPTNVSRKNEDSMVNFAHSTAQKNVTMANFSVPEASMKLDAKPQANVEIKKNINGDQELKPNPRPNALDIVQPNVLPMKFFAHHS